MIAILSGVVRNIVILIILVSILEMLLPRKDFRPFVNMVVGLVLMLMLLQPLRSVLQLPGLLDPVWEMRDSITDEEVAAKTAMLDQVNWDMTLAQYKELVTDKIDTILQAADLQLVELVLTLEEDVSHLEFGTPRKVLVIAQKKAENTDGGVAPVERVEVTIGKDAAQKKTGERNTVLEAKIVEALGIPKDIVEVRVLTE